MMLSASEAFERQEAYGSSRARQRDIVEDVAHDSAESPPPRHAQAQGLALEHVRSPSKQEHPDDSKLPLYPRGDELNARVWANHASQLLDVRGQEFQRVGLCLENLGVFGYGTSARFQQNVANIWLAIPGIVRRFIFGRAAESRVNILRRFDALIHPGEMCVVLGPPGSGCSTFLKTISGDTHGLDVSKDSYFNYHGISAEEMHNAHRGDVIYTAEADVHFPILTVGETLTFASHARCPMELPQGVTRDEYCQRRRDVVMAMYGISHTLDTKVGDDFVRGVSGGERKRVTIAEATLANAPFQCWDNSTRGLDSANAIEFCKTLRVQSELFGQTCAVSMYQAPQTAYELFDKALVMYEGRQIYFGPTSQAKDYFVRLGFECAPRQTTPDFLTSMTFPAERISRPGSHPPRTLDDFALAWLSSPESKALRAEMEEYKQQHPIDGPDAETFRRLKKAHQANGQRLKSPYMLTYGQQIRLCVWRGWARFWADPGPSLWVMVGNIIMALIMSSLFYNMQQNTSSFYGRAVILFMAILFNSFSSILEVMTLYAQRPIVEKHTRYAFHHPSAESYASVLVDLPMKITGTISFNLVFYFMANLHRQPGNFFFYLLVVFLIVLAMSGVFRFIGSLSRTEQQAMVPASILMLALLIFTGFVVPVDYMLPWCRWINYVNPVAYGYEALMINEFHNRNFTCTAYIPDYATSSGSLAACNAVGAVPGRPYVNGDDYISTAYSYKHSHKWRNVGIILAMTIFNHVMYFLASEYVRAKRSKGEVLVFPRGQVPSPPEKAGNDVEHSLSAPVHVAATPSGYKCLEMATLRHSTSVFHWSNVSHDITIKKETRRILDNVDGWVKPGTLTALMGVSGAGKTSLLDCLADRRIGVITGEILVDGRMRDESFQRKTGYAQQRDIHLETTTIREALTFSALLRQPHSTPRSEKLAYVEEIIKMLEMQDYADAVVGVPGEGINVEQRKRLTIGVELVAKPPLLLFVDEPTSGLDSQSSWAILDLLDKLSKAGQSILCTIHQPSSVLFQRFDRLLLLAEGGKSVYFGDVGPNSSTLINYFERNGAIPCPPGANPAEWMLEAIGAAPGSHSEIDWHQAWRDSADYQGVQAELKRLKARGYERQSEQEEHDTALHQEFSAPLWRQFVIVSERTFRHSWRSPSYLYSKLLLCTSTSLFIGLVFLDAPLTIQGLQNQMFAIFEIMSVVGQLVDQQLPSFIAQRSLYEARERPSKTYSWSVFMVSQIISEIPWATIASIFMWALFYYPVGLHKNAQVSGQSIERGALIWLLFWQFLLWVSTFTHMCVSFAGSADDAGNIANFLFVLAFFFCGVLATPTQMPGFWIFLYRVSPLSYFVSAVLSTGLAQVSVTCAPNELITIIPPAAQSCGQYMADYISRVGGYLLDPEAGDSCKYCKIKDTDVFLAAVSSRYADRWRNFGMLWVYIVFNVLAAIGLYWLVRVPKGRRGL